MKKWTKPQLIIIERGLPGENILLNCKTIGATYALSAQVDGKNGCDVDPGDGNCGACRGRGGS